LSGYVCLFIIFAFIVGIYLYQKQLFDKHLQSFIELNTDITVITTATKIIAMNRAGLNFFGFEDNQALLKKTKYLNRLFKEIVTDDKKYVNSIDWVTRIDPRQTIKVQMKSKNIVQTFNMKVNKIREDRYIVFFHNITKEVIEKEEYGKSAYLDELTHIYNRKKFNEVLAEAMRNAQIKKEPFSIILFDIDHFKKINDTYGHDTGDIVLRQIAALIRQILEKESSYVFARWGGEEFIILCKGIRQNEAYGVAELLRKEIDRYPFEKVKHVTSSFGVTEYYRGDTAKSLLERADEALYHSKRSGRNRVSIL
jgi:diguanylate cyclase (GGDEF)-like protein